MYLQPAQAPALQTVTHPPRGTITLRSSINPGPPPGHCPAAPHRQPGQLAQFSALASSGFAALARGEYQPASDQLGTALALWGSITLKSQILPEAAGRPFAVQTREKLWQARKDAGIGKAAADINLGLHRRAAAELTLMADEWSHDREILRLLVIALHRCGLTEKVSEMCGAAIEATRELGLDDGALLKLQQDLLAGALPLRDPVAA